MKAHLLAYAGGVSLLCLLADLLPLEAMPVVNKQTDTLAPNETRVGLAASSKLEPDSEVSGAQLTPSSAAVISQSSQNTQVPDALAQVTSVSQLSDVQPTDWAFQSLQSLVERYGCIAGYPDGTYRGNRALTRYEFAAGLNACLDRVNELISSGSSNVVRREDLATLQRLQAEFAAELATLRGRVDALEASTAELEANQFSTTTKLSGEAIVAVVSAGGGAPNTDNPNTILVDRVRLNLTTSFTGKDALITGLQAYNLGGGNNSIGGALGLADPLGLSSSNARLGFEPLFPGVDPKTLSSVGSNNSIQLYKLLYVFPVAKSLTLFAGPAAETTDAGFGITPFYSEGQEAVSRFAGLNPVARVSGGTSGTGLASAAGFIWSIAKSVDLRALYGSVNANLPSDQGFPATPLGAGFFNGSTVVATQLTFKPSSSIDIALNYANSHHQLNILATGLGDGDIGTLSGLPATQDVHVNSVGGTATWRVSSNIALAGYGAVFFVNNDGGPSAKTTITSWMGGLHFTDLFKKGNTAGILFGQPLYRTDADGAATLPGGRTTPYHLEAYYRIQVTDNISVTPGAFVLFNPEGNRDNDTTAVGVLRTTFTF